MSVLYANLPVIPSRCNNCAQHFCVHGRALINVLRCGINISLSQFFTRARRRRVIVVVCVSLLQQMHDHASSFTLASNHLVSNLTTFKHKLVKMQN